MAPETRAPSRRGKTPPHALVLSQVERILADENFRDRPTLPELLRYLVEIQHAGRYDPPFTRDKPKPTGKMIVEEFYRHRFRTFMEDPPEAPALAGKKLVAQLRRKLDAYYERADPETHGRIRIVIPDRRGTAYRPRIGWFDALENGAATDSGPDTPLPASAQEHATPGDSLAAALNARFGFLNDPEFGHEIARYFDFATAHGIYCHNLRTTFSFQKIFPRYFPNTDLVQSMVESFVGLQIDETVEKICASGKLRFAALLHPGSMTHHFARPDIDFVWYIDLPRPVEVTSKISDIFRIVTVAVDGSTIISNHELDQEKLHIVHDDHLAFIFEIDIAEIAASRRLRKLSYKFFTLKAKSHKCFSYGPRFLTRNLSIKVLSHSSSNIDSWISEARLICAERPESSGSSGSLEISASGWVLPESGVTFSFDCRLPDRPDSP